LSGSLTQHRPTPIPRHFPPMAKESLKITDFLESFTNYRIDIHVQLESWIVVSNTYILTSIKNLVPNELLFFSLTTIYTLPQLDVKHRK
jgi:hypothetical protein